MKSEILRVDVKDFFRAIVTAIFAAVVIALYGIVTAPGFDIFTVDWTHVIQAATNASVAAFFGYLAKNLLSDTQGKFLGKM